jgi:hypothetical protein
MGTKTLRWAAALGLVAGGLVFGVVASPWAAAESGGPEGVAVISTRVWTDTALVVRAGDSITVAARGFVHFGRSPLDRVTPSGTAWGPRCLAIARSRARFAAPGLSCWSLIARLGTGAPFEIGTASSFRARDGGELSLGVNDNDFRDNSGNWSATVTIASPIPTRAAGSPVVSATHPTSRTSVVLFAIVIAAAVALGLYWKRKAARDAAFAPVRTLRAGRMKVRIAPDRSMQRFDSDGIAVPFVISPSDFVDVPFPKPQPAFAWRGLQFRAVKSRIPFLAPHGEVTRVGQSVAASAGVVHAADGYAKGRVPTSLPGVWVFVRGTVNTDYTEEQPTVDGEITAFIRADEPFGPQADTITKSIRAFLAHLDALVDLRPPAVPVQTRLARHA